MSRESQVCTITECSLKPTEKKLSGLCSLKTWNPAKSKRALVRLGFSHQTFATSLPSY
jgi:hypothetical protein